MYNVNPLAIYQFLFLPYLLLLSCFLYRTALVNFVLFRGLTHEADGLIVILAKNLQLLVVKITIFLILAGHLHLILVSSYLKCQIDRRPLRDAGDVADGTFSVTFPFPEFL